MAKVYLEPSFFSASVTMRSTARIAGWRATSLEWWRSQSSKHRLFISPEVVVELSSPEFQEREAALEMLRGLALLDITPEVLDLAELLVNEQVMPNPPNAGDAIHVAVATVHRMAYILSWNIQHLANENKRRHLEVICLRLRYVPPLILTPDMLWEDAP
jgi:hypothetical protein